MKIRATAPTSRAAHATACPWLPALAATTPAASSSVLSVATRLKAPRTLKEPVRWRFSAFRWTSRPTNRDSVSEPWTGVTRATPSSRARACSISGRPGAVAVVANPEHLLQYLPHRAERIEPALLHLVEQPPQLGVVGDRVLEVLLRPAGGDGEDLAREVPPTPLVEPARFLEVGAVRRDLLPQLRHVLAARRLGEHDRRPPLPRAVEREDRAHLAQHRLRGRMVHLVHGDHVGNLHDPGLQGLHRVAGARHQHEQHRVGDADDLDLALTGADGLEEDEILARRVEHEQCLQRRLGEPTEVAPRAHRADEDAGIEKVVGEPDPVAEQRPLREGARGIDRDDADARAVGAHVPDERRDEARLADAWRAGEAHGVRLSRLGIEVGDDVVGERVAVLDERDRTRERATVALADTGGEGLPGPVAAAGHRRPL